MRGWLPLWILVIALYGQSSAQELEFFENKVRPVLARHCYSCHGPDKQFSGLRVDSRDALLRGGKRGAALTPGDVQQTLLLRAVRHQEIPMPLGGKLSDADIAALTDWVQRGAPWPNQPLAAKGPSRYQQLVQQHWAFQPVKKVTAPKPGHLVDAFLPANRPAPPATLLRRLSFVLTGLPPTPEDLARNESFDQSVDRLLASPHYGEQWARRWMDLMRFAETRGYEWNYEIAGAWRYRDYLIRAFNADLPYSQLIREHLAGDLLEQPRIDHRAGINESVIGTAFFRLGEAGHDDCIQFREIALDVIDNQIDTLTKGFLGLTVACARCHDHKLDPIPTKDYYGLYGILNSSRPVVRSLASPAAKQKIRDHLTSLRRRIRAQLARTWTNDAPLLAGRLSARQWTATKEMADLETLWSTLESQGSAGWDHYLAEARRRDQETRKNYEPFDTGWMPDGAGIEKSRPGEFVLASSGDRIIEAVLPAGIYSGVVSPRVQGALRSPQLPKRWKYISVRAYGGSLAARRTVIDNCAIGEQNKLLEGRWPAWTKAETYAREQRLPVFLELVTRWANPRYPDRPGVLKPDQEKLLAQQDSYFGWAGAVAHDVEESPQESLTHILRLADQPLHTPQARAAAFAKAISDAVQRWAADQAGDDDARWIDWALRQGLLANRPEASPELAALLHEYRTRQTDLGSAEMVEGLADAGVGHDYPVLIAGGAKSYGETAPRRLLGEILAGPIITGPGSGRRELAEQIASPQNPLTARVMVNRIWQAVFGEGLVRSVDNFGALGEKPDHPELLDALATRFLADGWSIKKLMRLLLTSAKFREAAWPLRRLTAEELRDAMLATAGELKPDLYGESISPHRTAPETYRKLLSGPLDGAGRRSIYTKLTRMEGPAFLETFDFPLPLAGRGRRDVTNVPAQALTLLNDPFVIEIARRWGAKFAAETTTPEQRIDNMFRRALARPASPAEQQRFRGLAAELASLHKANLLTSEAVWKDVAHAVFNLKEFLYVP
jgi:hypothetical protein